MDQLFCNIHDVVLLTLHFPPSYLPLTPPPPLPSSGYVEAPSLFALCLVSTTSSSVHLTLDAAARLIVGTCLLLILLCRIAARCVPSQQATCRRAPCGALSVSTAVFHPAGPSSSNMQSHPSHLHADERAIYRW